MDMKFHRGQKLKALYWANGSEITVGLGTCEDIEVIMENGQMAGVPWALARHSDGIILKHNLAKVESVKL